MKRLISVFLALLYISALLSGCSSKTPASPSSTASPSESSPVATEPVPTLALTAAPEPPDKEGYVTGNSNSNLNRGGIIVKQDDWIYYSGLYDGFYKSRIDGSEKTKLTDSVAFYINIVNEWLYYCTMDKNGNPGPTKKIKTDGTGEVDLGDMKASYLNIVGDWIYYKSPSGDPYDNWDDPLFRMRYDGTEKSLVFDDKSMNVFILDDWIYYSNQNDKPVFTKIRTDGTDKTEIADGGFYWVHVDDNYIYYISWIGGISFLFKMKPDGNDKSKIAEFYSSELSISEPWIYYENGSDNKKLYRIRTDGSHNEKVYDYNAYQIYVVDDLLYCWLISDPPSNNLFLIDTDKKAPIEIK